MKLQADFNGLFGDVLCLSHNDSAVDQEVRMVILRDGMSVVAFDEDQDKDGNRDYLVPREPSSLRRIGFSAKVRAGFYELTSAE